MEDFYKEIYAVNGISDLKFPDNYPVSRLLGCVEVVGCITCDELQRWEEMPEGVRLEGQTDYCWLCEQPQKLIIPFEMRGRQGVYNLERKNAILEFGRVVKAKEHTVAGTLHHLTIEALEAGNKKLYEAKVWVKPWLDFKELQEFKHVGDSPSFTPSDLGACREGHAPGWKEVPNHDPEVQNAANHALNTIQQRSNSLFPYELQEVVHAKAEVAEDSAKFNLRLKVKRGEKDEEFNVEVHKNNEGDYRLKEMGSIQPEH